MKVDSEYEDVYESSEKDDDDDADFEPEKPVFPVKLKARGNVPARKLEAEFSDPAPAPKPRGKSSKKLKQPPLCQNGGGETVIIDDVVDPKVSGRGRKKLASKAIPVIDDIQPATAPSKESSSQKKASKKRASSKAAAQDEAIGESLSVRAHKLAEAEIVYADLDKRTKQYRQLKTEENISATAVKKLTAKKKKVPVESSNNSTDDEDEDDDDGDVEFIENPNQTKDEGTAGGDSSASVQSRTPLSQIWTIHVDNKQAASAEDATKTLVYKQDFVWDDELFANNDEAIVEKREADVEHASPARDRPLGKRQMRSVQQSHIRQNLMTGNLDPHTMVQCESYRSKDDSENLNSRSRGNSSLEPPFQIQVHPDAVFVCDLHAHLATCEIIGFLGGRWDEATKTLYIQAAFPCRSLMIDGDDGSTDVEMDPGSEIELREIIQNAQLEVVGWYHSHPAFAPDPSIRDIENQTSYQQLFQRRVERKIEGEKAVVEISEPFVGLIVGTYDTKRDTPVSLFRYFHTRGEKVSGGARREIHMPYELVPARRHYRAVLSAERRAETSTLPMYPSVFEFVFGKQSTPRMKSVELPKDNAVSEIFAGIDSVLTTSKKDASQSRKRKLSSDLPVKAEVSVKKVKGKRGRKRKVDLSSAVNGDGGKIDLTGEDVDAEHPAKHQSAAPQAAVAAAEENADELIDVDAETSRDSRKQVKVDTEDQKSVLAVNEPSAALTVRLRVAPKVSLPEVVRSSVNPVNDGSVVGDVGVKADEPSLQPQSTSVEPSAAAEVTDSVAQVSKRGSNVDLASSSVVTELQTGGTVVNTVEPEAVSIVEKSSSFTAATMQPLGAKKKEDVEVPEATKRRKEVQKLRKEVDQRKKSTSFDTAAKRRSTRHQKLPEATRALVADTKPVTIDLVDEDEAVGEGKAEENGSPEAVSTTPPSLALDSNSGTAGGRRRGRKPIQTQRKSTTFYTANAYTKDDRSPHNAQSGAVATQIEVYDAFGSASGVSKTNGEKENLAHAMKKEGSSSTSNVATASISANGYVFLEFSASQEEEKTDKKPVFSLLRGPSEDELLKIEDERGSNISVLESADEAVSESQPQSSNGQDERSGSSAVISIDDEVIPESQSQSPPVQVEAVPEAKEVSADTCGVEVKDEREQAALSGPVDSAIVILPSDTAQIPVAASDVTAVLKPAATVKVEAKPVEVEDPLADAGVDSLPLLPSAQVVKTEVSVPVDAEGSTSLASDASSVVTKDDSLSLPASENNSVPEASSNPDELPPALEQKENEQSDVPACKDNGGLKAIEVVVDGSTLSDEPLTKPAQETVEVPRSQIDKPGQPESEVCDVEEDVRQPKVPIEDESVSMDVDADETSQTKLAQEQMAAKFDSAQTHEASPESSIEESTSMEIDDESAPQVSSQPLATLEVSAALEIEDNAEAVSSQSPTSVEVYAGMEIEDSVEAVDVNEEVIASSEAVALMPAVNSEHGDEAAAKSSSTEVIDNEARETEGVPVQASRHAEPTVSKAVLPISPPAVKLDVAAYVAPVSAEVKTCDEVSAPAKLAEAEAKPEVAKPDGEPLLSGSDDVEVSATGQPLPEPPTVSSASFEDAAVKSEVAESDVVVAEPEADAKSEKLPPVKLEVSSPAALLFGSGRQVEDIRTSLDRIRPLVEKMIEDREAQQQAAAAAAKTSRASRRKAATKLRVGGNDDTIAEVVAAATEVKPDTEAMDGEVNLFKRQQEHLHRLRTKYGDGISGCAEQVITLVDYYRDFERRIDLNETWKAKVNKLSKIEASMSEYVRYVNLPVDLREEFVQVRIACLMFHVFAMVTSVDID